MGERIYVSPEGKNLEIKTLEKSPWKKCHWKKSPVFWISGIVFPKIVWGLPIKSQEKRSQEIKF